MSTHPKTLVPNPPPGGDISLPSDKSFAQPDAPSPPQQRHHHHRVLNAACGPKQEPAPTSRSDLPVPKDSDVRRPTLPIPPPPAPEAEPSAATSPPPPVFPTSQPTRPLSSAPDAAECQAGLAQPTRPGVGGVGVETWLCRLFLSLYLFPPTHPPPHLTLV